MKCVRVCSRSSWPLVGLVFSPQRHAIVGVFRFSYGPCPTSHPAPRFSTRWHTSANSSNPSPPSTRPRHRRLRLLYVELVSNDRIGAQYPLLQVATHYSPIQRECLVTVVVELPKHISPINRTTYATVGALYKFALPPTLPLVRNIDSWFLTGPLVHLGSSLARLPYPHDRVSLTFAVLPPRLIFSGPTSLSCCILESTITSIGVQ